MTLFKQIRQILVKGFMSALWNENGQKRSYFTFIIFYIVVPLAIVFISTWFKLKSLDKLINPILAIIAVFVAFVFQIVFTSSDKYSTKFEIYSSKNDDGKLAEHYKNYMIRLRNLTKLFIQILSFLILLSLIIMVISLLYKVLPCGLIRTFLNSIVVSLFYLWLVYLIDAVIDMYRILMDDINKKLFD